MRSAMQARLRMLVIATLLLVAVTIVGFEYFKPSTGYWWRQLSEMALTELSENSRRPIGLEASKAAFKLRRHESSASTIMQLAQAAERHGEYSLSAVARVYLAHAGNTYSEEALRLAKDAFDLEPNELTAWQYAACLQYNGGPLPAEVRSLLSNGASWEYAFLVGIDSNPEAISKSVGASAGSIDDGELFRLAELTTQNEADYDHWSRSENRMYAIGKLAEQLRVIRPIAEQNVWVVFIEQTLKDFARRTVEGLEALLTNPGPVEVGTVVSKVGRRFMGTIDAIAAVGTAVDGVDQVHKAKEAVRVLENQIADLESGAIVSRLSEDVARNRQALIDRLSKLLSDPRRYKVGDELILAAIEGGDPSRLFLSTLHGEASGER